MKRNIVEKKNFDFELILWGFNGEKGSNFWVKFEKGDRFLLEVSTKILLL